jgi:hypothetical protein
MSEGSNQIDHFEGTTIGEQWFNIPAAEGPSDSDQTLMDLYINPSGNADSNDLDMNEWHQHSLS